jgi:hypothetical protein
MWWDYGIVIEGGPYVRRNYTLGVGRTEARSQTQTKKGEEKEKKRGDIVYCRQLIHT